MSALQNIPVFVQRKPSPQQEAVYTWVRTGRGNAIVVAVAGSGKTTTLIDACEHMRGSVAMVAYNKKIAVEFQGRLEQRGLKHVKGGTAHSFGFSAWRYACKNTDLVVDERKKWDQIFADLQVPEQYQGFVKSLVSLAKQRAIGVLCPIDRMEAWYEIVEHFDLAYELADECGNDDLGSMVSDGVKLAVAALVRSIELAREIIDYDDMIYMPLKANCRMWQNDWLLVDEAQDTNPARRALYKKMLKPGGRAIFVGDPAQAIYGFTGADNDSLDLIKREFNCCELPLTVTFRCPKSVVAWAQQWVGHIQAAPTNAQGNVETVQFDEFISRFQDLRPQDAILCRNTKPLVEVAFSLIRAGVACHVEGKEIGRGLVALTKRWKVTSLAALKAKLETFLERETRKLMAKGKEASAAAISDRVETVLVIADAMPPDSKVADLRAKIESMFSDTVDGRPSQNLTLCTVHKSKGLEWKNVYLLGRNRYMPSPFARQTWQMQQEDNLCYVAGTRSMSTLTEIVVSNPISKRGEH